MTDISTHSDTGNPKSHQQRQAVAARRPHILRDAARWRGKRIGLYGGSFNPSHMGHLHVALTALKVLDLDAVWLMVSPGNPFKDAAPDMAPFDARLESARELADLHPRIVATDIEQRLGTRYTAETTAALVRHMPATAFTWMMGADNLASFHRWTKSSQLIHTLPIAVFDRPMYSRSGLASRFAKKWRSSRTAIPTLKHKAAPAWTFVTMPKHWASATEIRRQIGPAWTHGDF